MLLELCDEWVEFGFHLLCGDLWLFVDELPEVVGEDALILLSDLGLFGSL